MQNAQNAIQYMIEQLAKSTQPSIINRYLILSLATTGQFLGARPAWSAPQICIPGVGCFPVELERSGTSPYSWTGPTEVSSELLDNQRIYRATGYGVKETTYGLIKVRGFYRYSSKVTVTDVDAGSVEEKFNAEFIRYSPDSSMARRLLGSIPAYTISYSCPRDPLPRRENNCGVSSATATGDISNIPSRSSPLLARVLTKQQADSIIAKIIQYAKTLVLQAPVENEVFGISSAPRPILIMAKRRIPSDFPLQRTESIFLKAAPEHDSGMSITEKVDRYGQPQLWIKTLVLKPGAWSIQALNSSDDPTALPSAQRHIIVRDLGVKIVSPGDGSTLTDSDPVLQPRISLNPSLYGRPGTLRVRVVSASWPGMPQQVLCDKSFPLALAFAPRCEVDLSGYQEGSYFIEASLAGTDNSMRFLDPRDLIVIHYKHDQV